VLKRISKVALILLGVVALTLLAFYIATNSQLSLTGSGLQNGEATVETDLPNATCKKVVRLAWPPVRLECEEKEELED
jgi:hypothetical protein